MSLTNLNYDTTDAQYELCPTMDIISVVRKKSLTNYRINWEKIYEIPTNDRYPITYKGDGKFFLLVDKDMNMNIYDTNEGQLITTINYSKQLELISWSECYNGEIIDNNSMFEHIEKSLPLILSMSNSILEDKEKFDFILYGGEGQLNLSIFGIFNIENLIKLEGSFLAHVCNTENAPENYILCQRDEGLVIHKLDISFLNSYPNLNHLSLICSKISKYFVALEDAIKLINVESRIYIEHSKKIIELLKDESATYVDDLYIVLLTGMVPKGVNTWLTDYLAVVGLTRWQTLLTNCFHKVRSILFAKVIPILERLIVNYTNFTQLITNKAQDQIITKLQSLLKVFYRFINDLNKEFRNFNKFIEWLNLVLKDLDEDLSEAKRLDVVNALSHTSVDIITKFLTENIHRSCISSYTLPQSEIMTLSRDSKVFINAKFSILKMEIKKQMQLSQSFNIPNINVEYYEYVFTRFQQKLYLFTLLGNNLDILITDLQKVETETINFDEPICKIKLITSGKSIAILLSTQLITLDIDTMAITDKQSFDRINFKLYNMALNKETTLIIDQNCHLISKLPSGHMGLSMR